ncbi:5'-3' exonuclease PLD3-like [Linepithema humile]|uniref:5'-3' exonuclease PLD3-like n=1 Tax=Linepithema humile TaxID=83485 RepID=UPI0006237CED|nr:PREDICTED: phospholipase D3-like [Linepithema humile]XP_012223867.1 PREDICTED: phospholipase D3-like [Linepithema humile]XP_012223876.1 PREDICTED: phospholipase D3-like [Linepithema humile]XP_012223882.1 PREDICTED: phospholipase D3-like [Linepithema humile]XP_012223891.1 PREDICTED: phospholipase D3-like [Linepithema humile]
MQFEMSFFGWKMGGSGGGGGSSEHTGRNLQDGLFQIASQACHILVQVNNTHNVSYGGSNNVNNVAYSKYSTTDSSVAPTTSSSTKEANAAKTFPRGKDQDVVVLLPHRKNRAPRLKHKLSTVSENARLDVNSPGGDDDLELWDQSGFMLRSDVDDHLTNTKWGAQGWCRPSCIPITIILVLIVLVVLLPLLDHAADKYALNSTALDSESMCMNRCNIFLVETIPIGMNYSNNAAQHETIYDSWMNLIGMAQDTIEIASLYWTMKREDVFPDDSAKEGEQVFQSLLEAGRDRQIVLKIAQNIPSRLSPNIDTQILAKKANAQVRSLNFAGLLGGGVLHTKLWLIDRTHVYVGSANMDWRSLSHVKELGLVALNCSCLANDYAKIFDVYWKLGEDGKVPSTWPDSLSTKINIDNPMNFTYMDNKYKLFIASSPPPFSPKGRSNDLDAILHCIDKAEKFIYISVMDYFPLTIYTAQVKYWPIIDNALRAAAIERKIDVRLLISKWKHSRPSESYFLKSLQDLTRSYQNVKIEVRRFVVPTDSQLDKIPFARVNHNKYMVTDIAAYIGTSNWSGDYFIDTAGIGTVFENVGQQNKDNIRQQLENIFYRDWNSNYSFPLNISEERLENVINSRSWGLSRNSYQ